MQRQLFQFLPDLTFPVWQVGKVMAAELFKIDLLSLKPDTKKQQTLFDLLLVRMGIKLSNLNFCLSKGNSTDRLSVFFFDSDITKGNGRYRNKHYDMVDSHDHLIKLRFRSLYMAF